MITTFNNRKYLIFILLFFLLIPGQILSAKKDNKSSNEIKIPKWFLNPPIDKNYIYSVGYGSSKSRHLALTAASNFARTQITRELKVEVNSVTTQILEQGSKNGKAQIKEMAEQISKQTTSNILMNSKIIKQEVMDQDGKYIAYVLIGINLEETKNAIDGVLLSNKDDLEGINLDKLSKTIKKKINKKFDKKVYKQDKSTVEKYFSKSNEKFEPDVNKGKKPDWVKSYPYSDEYYVGIGTGDSALTAKNTALNSLVTQIEVSVESEIKHYLAEINGVVEEEVAENLKLTVKESIENLELVGLWYSNEEGYWAYYRLNIEEYKRKQQQEIDNAVINGLDFLQKSDEENDPALKFKYAFLGYYLTGKYVTKTLKAEYNGKQVILVNELVDRMQKIMGGFRIKTQSNKYEIDKINPQSIKVTYNITYNGIPVRNFPVSFENNKGELDISKNSFTDSNGNVTCVVNKAIANEALQSFWMKLRIESFIAEAVEGEEQLAVFYKRIKNLGIPAKETFVDVNLPVFSFKLNIKNDLNNDTKYQNYIKAMSSNFKNDLENKIHSKFTESNAKYKLEMNVIGSISKSESSGSYFTRLIIDIKIIDLVKDQEIFSKSIAGKSGKGIKGGSASEGNSVKVAIKKFEDEYNEEVVKNIIDFINGK